MTDMEQKDDVDPQKDNVQNPGDPGINEEQKQEVVNPLMPTAEQQLTKSINALNLRIDLISDKLEALQNNNVEETQSDTKEYDD